MTDRAPGLAERSERSETSTPARRSREEQSEAAAPAAAAIVTEVERMAGPLDPERLRELLPSDEELDYRPGVRRRDDEGLGLRIGLALAGHLDRIATVLERREADELAEREEAERWLSEVEAGG